MSIKHAILGLLADRPMHGYDLKGLFEREVAPRTQLNFGQVYATLERLQRDGLVTPEVVNQEERPDKTVYELTDAGRSELEEWLATTTDPDLDLRNETFLKIIVARRLPGGDPLAVIASARRKYFEELHKWTLDRDQVEQAGEDAATLLMLELAVQRLDAFLKWLDRCEELLREEAS
jgi:DNA-binding PadR family transcriptional regulator